VKAPHSVIDFCAGQDDLLPLRLAFGNPCQELFAWSGAEVRALLTEVDALARRGFWCVGYLRYEAACAFEPSAALHASDGPLAYFSVHEHQIDFPDLSWEQAGSIEWQRQISRASFGTQIDRIREAIARGEVYQVNLTSQVVSRFEVDPFLHFCALRRAQPRANAAFFSNAQETILSVSPELFFAWNDHELQCRPMKGTAPRGHTPEADRRSVERLRNSAKERSENVMIVDLIRNDMSRVAQPGSVKVTRLFECEPWPTVWQMTSSVVAHTRPNTRLLDVFQALFPCGSITGAPKLRAMHWIRELEPGARGVYCGAAGVVLPGGSARFNVPIRTVTVREGRASCGVGSGVTFDSTAEGEWAEWDSKTQFLQQASRPFRLLQTVRIQHGQPRHLELHLDRLEAASAQFGFAFEREAVRERLENAAMASDAAICRARVTVDVRSAVVVEISELPHTPGGLLPVALATHAVAAPSAFLRHKTTRRDHYEEFAADTPAAFDTLLWNDRGEVTEFTRGNVIIESATGERLTPPLHCGLLDGVGRACELATGHVQEAVVRVEELRSARRIWFVNALRGLVPVYLNSPAHV
jgi:para-aminobenzoate synthetase/4-amino-4-deoxychorismate lyase